MIEVADNTREMKLNHLESYQFRDDEGYVGGSLEELNHNPHMATNAGDYQPHCRLSYQEKCHKDLHCEYTQLTIADDNETRNQTKV